MARKRKPGIVRTKSGQRSRAYRNHDVRDHGTKQSQEKRHAWINGADPQLAASASGIMLANGQLDEEQHLACLRYARCHAIIYRRLWHHVQNVMGAPLPWASVEPTEEQHQWAERNLSKWAEALTPEQKSAITDVSCFGHLPTWSYKHKIGWQARPEDETEREALLSGLRILADLMGISARKTRPIEGAGPSWGDVLNQQKESDNDR